MFSATGSPSPTLLTSPTARFSVLRPWGHHLTNVILHAMNAAPCFFFFCSARPASLWRSFFAAALFGFHPLRVESVAWVAERKDVLCASFFILTLISYAKFARARKNYGIHRRGISHLCALTLRFGTHVQIHARHFSVCPAPDGLLAVESMQARRLRSVAPGKTAVPRARPRHVRHHRAHADRTRRGVMSAASFTASQRVNNALVSYWLLHRQNDLARSPRHPPTHFRKNEWPDSPRHRLCAWTSAGCHGGCGITPIPPVSLPSAGFGSLECWSRCWDWSRSACNPWPIAIPICRA